MSTELKRKVSIGSDQSPIGSFDDAIWLDLTEALSKSFKMDERRREAIRSNPVLKLVGALPFLANCEEPERTALSHMATYVLAATTGTRTFFAHNFRDSADIFHRLERISHFQGGQQWIIDRGMAILAITMIGDHIHDAQTDRDQGKMNPVNAGHWNGPELIKELQEGLEPSKLPEMDDILGPVPMSFWDFG